jgi:hypothetical protein
VLAVRLQGEAAGQVLAVVGGYHLPALEGALEEEGEEGGEEEASR